MTRKRDIQAYEPYAEAALAAGCPPDQVENFCRIHYVAQAKQLRFHAACRAADEPGGPTQIAYGGARGPGKSHALLAQIGADDCQRCPRLKCLLLRRVGKSGREQFEDLRLKLFRRLPHEYRRTAGSITFTNGSRIILGHFQDESDVDAYLGLEYDVIGVEEATTLTHAKYVAVQSCNRTAKPNFRPRIYTTANPGGVGHAWYKQLFVLPYDQGSETPSLRSPDPGASGRGGAGVATRFIPATIDDNCFVNPDYRATLDGLTGWQKRAWRYGDWDIAAGQFFTTYRRDLHAVDPFPIPPNWPVWLAMDYGFIHYNVILLFAQDPEGPARRGTAPSTSSTSSPSAAGCPPATPRLWKPCLPATASTRPAFPPLSPAATASPPVPPTWAPSPTNGPPQAGPSTLPTTTASTAPPRSSAVSAIRAKRVPERQRSGMIMASPPPSTSSTPAPAFSTACPPSSTTPIAPKTCSNGTPATTASAVTTPTTPSATASSPSRDRRALAWPTSPKG